MRTAMPRYTILPSGRRENIESFMIPLTTAVIVFTYKLPSLPSTTAFGNWRSAALYLTYCTRLVSDFHSLHNLRPDAFKGLTT